jgi:hypothetical protein
VPDARFLEQRGGLGVMHWARVIGGGCERAQGALRVGETCVGCCNVLSEINGDQASARAKTV